jgi:hypothetical protein
LLTEGAMGELPDWYRTLKAAQVLGVAPWDLVEKPLIWQEWALAASYVEDFVRKEQQGRTAQKAKAGGKRARR